MKTSKLKRKQLNSQLNELSRLGAVARPPRQYRVPPTFGRADTKTFHVGSCERIVGEQTVKTRFRRKQTMTVECGGRLIAKLGSLGKRRVYCETCRARRREAQRLQRLDRSLTKLGHLSPREQVKDDNRRSRFMSRLRRGTR
jgi:hypothetical protein